MECLYTSFHKIKGKYIFYMLSLESSLLVFTEKGKEFSSVCFEVLYLSSKANLLETMYADDTKLQSWDIFLWRLMSIHILL